MDIESWETELLKDPNRLLTPAELGKLFRVDPKTVSRWAKSGRIESVKTLGGHRRFRAHVVKRALEDGEEHGAA